MTFSVMIRDVYHPTAEELLSIDIHALLPQREPFVMIDTLVAFDEHLTATERTIAQGQLFVSEGSLTAAGMIENVAQTCAARIGYVNKYILHRGIKIGYIGAIRNLEVLSLPAVGSKITTTMEVLEEVFGMILARAEVRGDDQLYLTTEMKIAITNNEVV